MTVFHRAAGIAAVFLVAGLTSVSTPSFAFELDRTDVITSILADSTVVNNRQSVSVPVADVATSVATITATDTGETQLLQVPADNANDEDVDYSSLAAAVAAQNMPDEASDELTCLAGAIYFEAKGESLKGQLAVAQVILNRSQSARFPKSICSVVTQRGQFSFVRGGRIPTIDPNRASYRTAMAVAQVALDHDWESSAGPALFFHARHVSPRWRRTQVASIGNHIFYR